MSKWNTSHPILAGCNVWALVYGLCNYLDDNNRTLLILWLIMTMGFRMMPVQKQLKVALEHFVLGPSDMPEMVQKAEQL